MSFGGRFSLMPFSRQEIASLMRRLEKIEVEKQDMLNIPISESDEKVIDVLSNGYNKSPKTIIKTQLEFIVFLYSILQIIYDESLRSKICNNLQALYSFIKPVIKEIIEKLQ